jgi:transcription antitermination factor NusG
MGMQAVEKLETKSLPQQWCMLLVRPGKEQDARGAFCQYRMQAYWPNYQPFVRWSPNFRRRRRTDRRAVIPGYLFVVPDPIKTFWDVIQRNKGIVNAVLRFSGEVARLKDDDIAVIESIERGMNTPKPGKSLHSFKTGDKVRFKDDELHRWPAGKIAGSASDGRVIVEVEMMGCVVPIQVFPHQIARFA